jgi:MOSC domain-containing protein YiiM
MNRPAHDLGDPTFAQCLAYVLELDVGELPTPPAGDPGSGWRTWLAAQGLGLVPIAEPAAFSWPGFWIAAIGNPARWMVMFGVPPGPVFDPAGLPGHADHAIQVGYAVSSLEVVPSRLPESQPLRAGRVEGIYVAADATAAMEPLIEVRATTEGLVGDRYGAGAGTFSGGHAPGSALTLIESEALATVRLADGSLLAPAQARRNVVTRGISLNDLVGRRFVVGAIECYGQRLCEPCAHWQRLTQPGVLRGFVHRGGLRADVLSPGVIRVGDPVSPV